MWQVAQVGTNMSRVVSFFGSAARFEQLRWACEQDAVLGLVVDLELRVVRPHVALAAGRRQPGQLDRGGVPGVAGGAGADRAVGVGLADGVATDAAAVRRPAALRGSTSGLAGRLQLPGWNCSAKATCSAVNSSFSP